MKTMKQWKHDTDVETVADTAEVFDPADPITKTVDVHQ